MTSVWSVSHTRRYDDEQPFGDVKELGFFASEDEASAVVEAARLLPGFADHPDGFSVLELELDAFEWADGFSLAEEERYARARALGIDPAVGPLPGEMAWYGVRTVYRDEENTFEERITVWRARTFEDAVALAEKEAEEYCAVLSLNYLGFAQSHRPFLEDEPIEPGMEVFSLLRESDLDDDDYLDRFFDSGREYQNARADDSDGATVAP